MSRRARHPAGLAPWADARPQYRLRLGPAMLPFDVLTDAALGELRSRNLVIAYHECNQEGGNLAVEEWAAVLIVRAAKVEALVAGSLSIKRRPD